MTQRALDQRNASFWTSLCGSGLARQIGVTEASPESLKRFDDAYLALYPYLSEYIPTRFGNQEKVLEIGLGYGTLAQLLAERGADYHGVDIADGPVAMVTERVRRLGRNPQGRIIQGSALELPFGENVFDAVYSIGCLHHTGNLERSVSEVQRVLAPGGRTIVMLYNRWSYRRLAQLPATRVRDALRRASRYGSFEERIRASYDTNDGGDAAPHTDYVSRSDVRRLFRPFSDVHVQARNFETLVWFGGRVVLTRDRLLDSFAAKVAGLDLYISATKPAR